MGIKVNHISISAIFLLVDSNSQDALDKASGKKAFLSLLWYTLWIRRIEHRKWNRGRNRLAKLVQTIAPSIPFPVFNPLYPHGTAYSKGEYGS